MGKQSNSPRTKVTESAVSRSAIGNTKQIDRISTFGWLELSPRAASILCVVVSCVICLGYTLYTNQTWEDSLITLRHSENLLNGNGLTYNPGTRVHGFTSPVNVLLLTACCLITGKSSYVATLWAYRVFAVASFAGSLVLLIKAVRNMSPRWAPASWFVAIAYLFDVKNVAFTTNGMETAFVLLFVAWAVYLISNGNSNDWLMRGLCWGGLMWCRPDGFVYFGALALAELGFLTESRWKLIGSFAKSAVVCALVYCPWFIWAWAYYGSPIPHTIIAKANVEQGPWPQFVNLLDNLLVKMLSTAAQVFRPIYFGDQVIWIDDPFWGRVVSALTKGMGIIPLIYFACPVKDRIGRAMSLSFVILCLYYSYMPAVYPWYFAPATLIGLLAIARAATYAAWPSFENASNRGKWRKPLSLAALVVLSVNSLVMFGFGSYEERVQQAEIEMGNRAVIGAWLKENGKPTDTVYLEPLGYIGYFSGMHMNDYPGLVSPEVVAARRKLPPNELSFRAARYMLALETEPDWLVLRSYELDVITKLPIYPDFQKQYELVRKFDVTDKLKPYTYVAGKGSLAYDSVFYVFRRKAVNTNRPTG